MTIKKQKTIHTKKWFKEHRQVTDAIYRSTLNGKVSSLLKTTKLRAKKYKISYDLDRNWLLEKFRSRQFKCEETGISFTFDKPIKGYSQNPYSPSLDRVIPKLGYIKENTKLVITAYNISKNQWNLKHFKYIMRAIVKGFKK